MIKLYLIGILIFASFLCSSINVLSQNKLMDMCSLITALENTSTADSVDIKLMNDIRSTFKDFEKNKIPNRIESDSIYKLLHLIYERAKEKDYYVDLMFELDGIVRRNAEVGQYLSELQHKIALDNTSGFLKAYELLSSEDRKKTRDNLIWLVENGTSQTFINKLDQIKNSKDESIYELKKIFLSID